MNDAAFFSASTSPNQLARRFQVAKIWSTNLFFPLSIGRKELKAGAVTAVNKAVSVECDSLREEQLLQALSLIE